jgi:hypothetical protein
MHFFSCDALPWVVADYSAMLTYLLIEEKFLTSFILL